MDKYEVYLHNIPKVSDEGKVVPIDPHQTQEFSDLDEAQKFAADHKDKFERVVVIGSEGDKQRMIERYMDGEHIVPEKKEEPEEPAAEPSAKPEADESSQEAN